MKHKIGFLRACGPSLLSILECISIKQMRRGIEYRNNGKSGLSPVLCVGGPWLTNVVLRSKN